MIWSIVLATFGIIGLILVGDKRKIGFALGFFTQILWIIYAVDTKQYGFIAAAASYAFVYAGNWWRWRADERKAAVSEGLRLPS